MTRAGLLGGILLLACAGAADAGVPVDAATRAALQAAMQRHIDRQLVDGAFLRLDPTDGRVERLYPAKAHPMILRMGEHFVLCSDLRDEAGRDVNVDFFLAREGRGFVVFHTAVGDRATVERLMAAGKVAPVD